MNEKSISVKILDQFPPVDEAGTDVLLQKEIRDSRVKLVVLDDDPTGVQTVHDISVYTDWTVDSVREAFAEENRVFYILTNSRSMTPEETTGVHREITAAVSQVSRETGTPYLFLSRSDSTLRGHYPLEPVLLKEGMEADGIKVDGEILCFFFKEGGRYTIDNVHYVRQGDELVPAGLTEFAKDKTFGYSSSDLREYVEEKTGGAYPADKVVSIDLKSLRETDIDGITDQLLAVKDFNKVVVNAVDYCDLKVFAVALYRAIASGKVFMFRTAAGLVKVMGGISDRPLLTRKEMVVNETSNGGVVVVGSHTQKTTAQLEELLELDNVVPIRFDSNQVLEGDEAFYAEVDRCVAEEEKAIRSGKTVVCFTDRKLLTLENDTKETALSRSVKISDGVWRLVGQLSVTPAFVIAKGGITSSDIGTKALRVRRANVMGQIRPGIPVWQTGAESAFPKMPYVIFPGNTGGAEDLRLAVEILTEK